MRATLEAINSLYLARHLARCARGVTLNRARAAIQSVLTGLADRLRAALHRHGRCARWMHVIAPPSRADFWAGSYRSALHGHRAYFCGERGCFSLLLRDGPLPVGAVGAEWNDTLRIHYEIPKPALGPADHCHACTRSPDCQHLVEFPVGTTLCQMREGFIWLDEDEFKPTPCGEWGPALSDDDAWYVVDYPALAPAGFSSCGGSAERQ